jgi:tRNA threonylcarbamoyladenosine biosynthesis protein TsaE
LINFPFTILVDSEKDTSELANKLIEIINLGDVVCLNGNLGSGKTFFVKEFCKCLNIQNVSSPSFAIVNEYFGTKKVYHFDFYRLKKVGELFDIGFEEYLLDKEAIVFIEWANLFSEVLPKKRIEINIEIINDNKRKFTITKNE